MEPLTANGRPRHVAPVLPDVIDENDEMLEPQVAARLLGIGTKALSDLAADGYLPAARYRPLGQRRYPRSAVLRLKGASLNSNNGGAT